jgi:hypothetical protein
MILQESWTSENSKRTRSTILEYVAQGKLTLDLEQVSDWSFDLL